MGKRLAVLGYSESKELYECLKDCVKQLAKYCQNCGHSDCYKCPIDAVKIKLIMACRYVQRRIQEEERKLNIAMQELDSDFWSELELIYKDLKSLGIDEV